ncbi:cupin domain-containing protein [Cytobacillus oceanisediminis]|uniref:cupin domain-containing protein n=1 Tax=Cytobacillus oceanisediminis TaxID=665099 RepID=UPI001D140331|nr:cupin domain-containing protein [Cytobacillus oceanisediminis]MCC3646795.1 cupin domain-containing protein [Cytobacillus oceanisediminis]
MQVVTVNKIRNEDRPGITMKTIFDESFIKGGRTMMGTVSIPAGARIPIEGFGAHEQDEYGLVLKGSILSMSGGKEYRVSSGQATFIPRGEEHWAYNDGQEDCEIVWILVNR